MTLCWLPRSLLAAPRARDGRAQRHAQRARLRVGLISLATLAPASPCVALDASGMATPYTLLGSTALRTAPIDAPPPCPLTAEGPAGADALLDAAAQARDATAPDALAAAGEALEAALAGREPSAAFACAALTLARIELRRGRLQEAAAAALRAERGAGDDATLREPAAFYRAEALYLGRWSGDAKALYEALARAKQARIAAAASLRLADLRFDASPAEAHAAYEALLPKAEAFGADAAAWAPRAAEAAIAAGDLPAARRWLERKMKDAPTSELAAEARLRLADTYASDGDVAKALSLLSAVGRDLPQAPAGALARARTLDLRPDIAGRDEALTFLRDAARDATLPLSVYASALLASALAGTGAVDEALEIAARLSRAPLPAGLEARVSDGIDAALGAARTRRGAGDAGCHTLVRWLGGRVGALAARARKPEPFLDLGACYAQLGLTTSALETYREVARIFGDRGADDFTLLVAETALAAHETALARRIAESHAPSGPLPSRWKLLVGEVEAAEGHVEPAVSALLPLVRGDEPVALRTRALRALARVAVQATGAQSRREEIDAAVAGFAGSDAANARDARPALGEAALAVAQLHRSAGDAPRATQRYALAVEMLPAGAPRAEAGYWLGELSADPVSAEVALREAARADAGSWSRLAATALETARIRAELDGPRAAVDEAAP